MFDYSKIPYGHYDKVLDAKNGMRKFWHHHKFDSVIRTVEEESYRSLLDVGCFAGSFIGRYCNNSDSNYLGVDILENQIAYANEIYAGENKSFEFITEFTDLTYSSGKNAFDVITFIEVIEHLTHEQIQSFFNSISKRLNSNGRLILTTPNYISAWPLLEFLINRYSDVDYTEQHITKFNFFNFLNKIETIYPKFHDEYEVIYKTTSHFITPYISIFNYRFADYLSKKLKGENWHLPFGAMLLVSLRKK